MSRCIVPTDFSLLANILKYTKGGFTCQRCAESFYFLTSMVQTAVLGGLFCGENRPMTKVILDPIGAPGLSAIA